MSLSSGPTTASWAVGHLDLQISAIIRQHFASQEEVKGSWSGAERSRKHDANDLDGFIIGILTLIKLAGLVTAKLVVCREHESSVRICGILGQC
jgi:hypothetical protein